MSDYLSSLAEMRSEVRVATGYHCFDELAVLGVVQELNNLLGDCGLLVASAICRGHENAFVIVCELRCFTSIDGDPKSWVPKFLDETFGVL